MQLRASDIEQVFADSTLRVSGIVIIGNEVTKKFIIEREMSLQLGSMITHEMVNYDIERIYSLRLFTKVSITVVQTDSVSAQLIVDVGERWFLYPFPIVGLIDNNWKHLYYGFGLAHINVGGRAVQTSVQGAFGYDPFVSFSFYHPSVLSDNSIFLSTRLSFSNQKNRSIASQAGGVNFNEYRNNAALGIGKRLSIFSTVSVEVEYIRLTVSDNSVGRTLSSNATDKYFSLHAGYKYDTRDLAEYPGRGSYIQLVVSKAGFGGPVDYQRYSIDYRRYIPTYADMVVAARAFANIAAGGRVPNYGHMYFGYGDRIRGHFNEIMEGDQILGTSAEVHIPLLPPRYYRLVDMPIEQFRDIRYALNLAFFADAGTVWYRHEKLNLRSVLSGVGGGLHLLFAYSYVIRLEYAFSEKFRTGGAIITIGASF